MGITVPLGLVIIALGHIGLGQSKTLQGNACQPGTQDYLADPDDCAKFFRCVHGHLVRMDSPPGTVFSEEQGGFVHRASEHDKCTSANPVRECANGNADLIPHPTACQRYFNCSDNTHRTIYSPFQAYEQECTYPNVFDINLKRCVHFENSVCGNGRVTATWVCDYLVNRCQRSHCIPCSIHNPSCVGKEDGQWPNPEKLWSPYYTECQSQRSKNGEERCPSHELIGMTQLFHPEKRKCLPLWDIPKEHGGFQSGCESKPTGYYQMDGIEIISYHCPGEEKFLCRPPLYYHYNVSRCTPLQPAKPLHDPLCYGKDDGKWPHPVKLWSPYYFECNSQQKKNGEERCPSENVTGTIQLFHPENRTCLPLWDIPKEHGGYKFTCESKPAGYYQVDVMDIISYHCPGEETFVCRPPLYYHNDINRCTPIQN